MKLNLKKQNLNLSDITLLLDEQFNSNNYVKTSKFTLKENAITPWDEHKVSEIWLIAHGNGEIEINAKKAILKEGDIYFIPPFSKHRIKNLLAIDLTIFSIWWQDSEV